jgi:hypothetical protein
MTNVIRFPGKKTNITSADELLQQYVGVCLIKDKKQRQKQFEVLHLAIISYLVTKK